MLIGCTLYPIFNGVLKLLALKINKKFHLSYEYPILFLFLLYASAPYRILFFAFPD